MWRAFGLRILKIYNLRDTHCDKFPSAKRKLENDKPGKARPFPMAAAIRTQRICLTVKAQRESTGRSLVPCASGILAENGLGEDGSTQSARRPDQVKFRKHRLITGKSPAKPPNRDFSPRNQRCPALAIILPYCSTTDWERHL